MPDSLPATVLRLPMVYGPGDYQHRLFDYLRRMDDGRPAILLSKGMASWRSERGYVEDMGEAIVRCIVSERAAGRTYHVAENLVINEADWVRRIGEAAGWKGRIVELPEEQMPAHLREDYDTAQNLTLNTTHIREELGYAEPTPTMEAMARTVEWERANPRATVDPSSFDYAAEDAAMERIVRLPAE